MKILAISTSSSNASVSLLENDKVINELNNTNERTHSEKLMPLIDELLTSSSIPLSDINLIACDVGPGSFTGIRIGVATVKAIAEVRHIPIVSCSSLEALSYNVTDAEYICSLIDARNNQVYCAIFDRNHNLVSDYFADDINNLTLIFNKYPNMVFVGDGSKLLNNSSSFDNTIYSRNVGICGYKKYLNNEVVDSDNLSVLYLRKSQAERLKKNE